MEKKVEIEKEDSAPEIYAAISFVLNEDINLTAIINDLNINYIYDIKTRKPKNEATICLDIAVVRNVISWELNDVLTVMFSRVVDHLSELKKIATKYRADVYIDIACYQHGNWPALIICRENMKYISFLEANISIDLF